MSALMILFSLIIGYIFFMMSFYLLAKVLFPKMEQMPQEDSHLEKIETSKSEAARTSKSFSFNKHPQVA